MRSSRFALDWLMSAMPVHLLLNFSLEFQPSDFNSSRVGVQMWRDSGLTFSQVPLISLPPVTTAPGASAGA